MEIEPNCIEYTVVFDNDWEQFVTLVNERLQAGWRLQGGISLSVTETDDFRYRWFAQAMIREGATMVNAADLLAWREEMAALLEYIATLERVVSEKSATIQRQETEIINLLGSY